MEKVIHKAESRGHANHGWLDSHHTFSFAGYHNPERMRFGLLRVLNDDIVAGGQGFGKHPHDNMEIISIPLSGALKHEDTTGRSEVIRTHDVQIMSAGSGLMHSEFNHSDIEEVNFLQIWVFPKEKNIEPRYEQKTFPPDQRQNEIKTVVSPRKDEDTLWINQDAYFSLASLDDGIEKTYEIQKPANGVYAFVIEGQVEINGEVLNKRDGMGVVDVEQINIQAKEKTELLLIEVPMHLS
ncbi:MAG: pirin family protein [Fulvivirga sp.]|nr:pirin family protein [Fulvivirga sp.]